MPSSRLSVALVAIGASASLATGTLARPAVASQTGTVNTALGAAVGAVILYNNNLHTRQAANAVVGYTRNGGRVYGDGRIAMPDGSTYYPNSNGQYPWGQYAYYEPRYPNGYAPQAQYARHDNGLHRGWYKHRGRDENDHGDEGNGRGHHSHGDGD